MKMSFYYTEFDQTKWIDACISFESNYYKVSLLTNPSVTRKAFNLTQAETFFVDESLLKCSEQSDNIL